MKTHIIRIAELHGIREASTKMLKGKEMAELPSIKDAYISIEDGKITDFGQMQDFPFTEMQYAIDAKGGHVLPSFVDSHTHLVFAKSRETEFVDRIKGLTYQEIAAKGGGILNSAKALANLSEEELGEAAWQRLINVMKTGTGAIEIKSGYGLSLESELKMLRVVKRLKEAAPIPIKATFLGAHAFPAEFKEDKEAYIKLIIKEMLPAIAAEGLADYVDAFCEEGYFSLAQTLEIVEAADKYGLKPKIHVNQFNRMNAIPDLIKAGAISLDHLEVMDEADIEALKGSDCMATLLPGCSFFLGIPFGPARELIDRNVAVSLASDFNPGSCPTGNLEFIMSLACIKQRLLPEEAINALTINAAKAIELEDDLGSICKGKTANLIITKEIPNLATMPYFYGESSIQQVIANGKPV